MPRNFTHTVAIPKDEVNPDSLTDVIALSISALALGAENEGVALDWNRFGFNLLDGYVPGQQVLVTSAPVL